MTITCIKLNHEAISMNSFLIPKSSIITPETYNIFTNTKAAMVVGMGLEGVGVDPLLFCPLSFSMQEGREFNGICTPLSIESFLYECKLFYYAINFKIYSMWLLK